MVFEFILLALIEGQSPVELSRYTDSTPLYCLEKAADLNKQVRNDYVLKYDLANIRTRFLQELSDYQNKYGDFPHYFEKTLDLTSLESDYFYSMMSDMTKPAGAIKLQDEMSSEQNIAFLTTAVTYIALVDAAKANHENEQFEEVLKNNELGDRSSMLLSNQVRYVCLPAPR